MTTARDLALIALGLPADRAVERGDLSLALAGAEAADLLAAGALTLDGDVLVPGRRTAPDDRLLDQALASTTLGEPSESVQEWLWRRGEELAAAYVRELERAGLTAHGHGPRRARAVVTHSPEYLRAQERLASGDPVLTTLAAVLAIGDLPPDSGEGDASDGEAAVATVLAAVGEAVTELEAVRLRRTIETDAFDNIWRG
ncbi:GPP34 family phosphoprotein [Streptomyces sp. NRRL F-5727]|uniref:GPP34 family phosphoprotein n=1 Tax=Streptomyces sp. NRRL F-5727 TaxID=1463871 RepID=UPI0004C9955E|nr:GPP34 family phosphoprotein [Streptomyces sp. NRRL F-5727]